MKTPEERSLLGDGIYERVGMILYHGRGHKIDFDLENSPVAYYIHANTSPEALGKYNELMNQYAAGSCEALEFLKGFGSIGVEICKAMSHIVRTRQNKLCELAVALAN